MCRYDPVMVLDGERVPEVHKRCWNVGWMLSEATVGRCTLCILLTHLLLV